MALGPTVSLTPGLASLVLLGAATHASWNALVKISTDKLITQTLVIATGGVLLLPVALLSDLPAAASWPYLLGSAAIHNLYFFFLLRAYHWGDLSQVYPLSRGLAPLLVALLALVVADERLTATGTAGVVLVSIGLLSLAFAGRRSAAVTVTNGAKPLLFAAGTGMTVAAYTLCDGLGIRVSESPLGFIAWLFVISALPLVAATWVLRRGRIRPLLRQHAARGVVGGLLATYGYGVAIWALGFGAMAHVSALRETSVIFGALIGAVFLGEPFGRRRIGAAVLVAAGAALLSLGR